MEEGASPPRWALDKKLGEDASMEEKKEGEKERGGSTKLKEEKGRKEYGNISVKRIQNIQHKLNEVEDLASNRILSEDELKAKKSLQ